MGTLETWIWVNVGALVLAVVWGLCWSVGGVRNRRNDIVDVSWGLWFPLMALLVGGAVLFPEPGAVPRAVHVLALVSAWGLRLSIHIGRRLLRHDTEDKRYAAWRERMGDHEVLLSVLLIFVAQPILGVLIAQPVLVAVAVATADGSLWWLDVVALLVAIIGIVMEAGADLQLERFLARKTAGDERQRPSSRYLTTGVWAWSRNPNYAGDAIAWIGFGLFGIAAALANDAAWLVVPCVVGPVVMFYFLRYGSGVPLTERGRAGNPEWDAYVERTSVFWPRPPKRGATN